MNIANFSAAALTLVTLVAIPNARAAEAKPEPSSQALEQFEREVRPVLAKHCFECHGPKKEHNGLRVDSRAALLKGGDSGPAVAVGSPEKSLLIEAVKHESFEMPPEPSPKLAAEEIAALETWIRAGAPWSGRLVNRRRDGGDGPCWCRTRGRHRPDGPPPRQTARSGTDRPRPG